MLCPKCNAEMRRGELGYDAFYSKGRPILFWAPNNFFNTHMAVFATLKKAVSEGGMMVRVGNGFTSKRTTAYACKDCNCVLILNEE